MQNICILSVAKIILQQNTTLFHKKAMSEDLESNNGVNESQDQTITDAFEKNSEIPQAPAEETPSSLAVPEEDDEFGSFDEASFDEFQGEESTEPQEPQSSTFSSAVFQSEALIDQRVEETLDKIFHIPEHQEQTANEEILRDGAAEQFAVLSKIPHLLPPNWLRLNIRHKLLLNLGIPINLDEMEKGGVAQMSHLAPHQHQRKKSISEHDIDWSGFNVPEIESLNLDEEKKKNLMAQTKSLLDAVEEFNLQNTSQLFLETSSDEALDEKLSKMKENHRQLLELSAIWQGQIRELKNSQEMYELVVQNMVGYSQRLRREEILESLNRKKLKGKRSF